MIDSAALLGIPCVVTEQYRKAFGASVPELGLSEREDIPVFEKRQFSMLTPEVSPQQLPAFLKLQGPL